MTVPEFGPAQDRAGRVLDQIRLVGVTARGQHGVLARERRDGQEFTVDAVLHLDTGKAAASDVLVDTVDYGTLATRIADAVRGEPFDLIETLADRIAAACLAAPGVFVVDVAVHKPQAPITERFADVVVAIRRSKLPETLPAPDSFTESGKGPVSEVGAVLALGTNLGDRVTVLREAVEDLRAVPGITVAAVSPVVETAPVGGPPQPDYLNAVVLVTTSLSPHELLAAGQRIEAGHGRERAVRWGPRTLDIDVIRYGEVVSDEPDLELPHPSAAERAFVLAPWLAVDPEAWLPGEDGRRPVAPLLRRAPDAAGVRARPDLSLEPPAVKGTGA
jgi:dihydroneopterin aldolase/2-amino-4-hydroxy-6-hydroxymethyldihydropteridine diphosphokinase